MRKQPNQQIGKMPSQRIDEIDQLIRRTDKIEQLTRDADNMTSQQIKQQSKQIQQRTRELRQQNVQLYRAEWKRTRMYQEEPLEVAMRAVFSEWSELETALRAEFSEWSEGDEAAYYKANAAVPPYPSAKQLHLPDNMSAEYRQAEQRQT